MINHLYVWILLLLLVVWVGVGWWVSSRTFDYPVALGWKVLVALGWKVLVALFWPLFL